MGLDASYNFTSPGGKREKFSLDILFHRMSVIRIFRQLTHDRATDKYYFSAARNREIRSFKNFSSAGLSPAPAVCPHSDGIGTSETFGMNAAS